MAGPWERYATQSEAPAAGPWAKYAAASAPQQTAEEAMASPEGQKLAGELRNKADRMLLEAAGAESPVYAGLSSAANTVGLNVPRNIKAGIMSLQSGRPFSQEYGYLRDVDEAAARQSPYAAGGGMLAGLLGSAAALPVTPAASLAGRAAQGAAIGAGVSGASELADTKNLQNAGEAALGGAILGGVAPPALEVLVRGGGALGRAVAAPIAQLRNPAQEAERRVIETLKRDAAASGKPVDIEPFVAAQNRGQPVVIGDIGGETMQALARSAANTSPEARAALTAATQNRFESQAPRLAEFVMDIGGGRGATETREALLEQAKRINRPAYKTAYKEGDKGIWTPELERLSGSPDVLDAMKAAARTGKSRAINEGFGAFNPGVTITDDGRVIFQKGKQGVPTYPNLQYWDYVKQELDDAANAAARAGRKGEASRIGGQARLLREELDTAVPSYAEARAGAAAHFGAQDALEAGEKFVTARGKNAEYARPLAKMNPAERKLFAEGFASKLAQQINEIGDRRSVLNSIFNTPAARERVTMALGSERAKAFETYMRVEGIMDALKRATQGNSTTTRQLVEMGLAGGAAPVAGGLVSYASGEGFTPGAIFGALARRGKVKIDANVARHVGELLASDDLHTVKRGLQMVQKSPRLLEFVRSVDNRLGAALAGGGASVGEGLRGVADQLPARADTENGDKIPTVRR
jgi:hypothetical protein